MASLDTFGQSAENSLRQHLVEGDGGTGEAQFVPRQVMGAHYISVLPEPVPAPRLVIASEPCAEALGIDADDLGSSRFAEALAGNVLLPGLDDPYCTVYGCHVYGQWMGPLGDGRAMALGEVQRPGGERLELQLKGCGRSHFSRSFDGRAVLRSCVREFLASEAMHHLGVSTTRALGIVETGQQIRRAWYVGATTDAMEAKSYEGRSSRPSGGGFPPDRMNLEKGAIMCRVSPSFIRVAQLEIFAQRGEQDNLMKLADHACFREFPHLLEAHPAGQPARYVELFRCICRATARLVAGWLRTGYVQGNMNSDNILVGGRTLDYGPFAFMEKFDPLYQPFTSDQQGKFCFMRQPSAMAVNMMTLTETFDALVRHAHASNASPLPGPGLAAQQEELSSIAQTEFAQMFHAEFCASRGRKLGLSRFRDGDPDAGDNALWRDLEMIMYKQGTTGAGVDYTILFRELGDLAAAHASTSPAEAVASLEPAFYPGGPVDTAAWTSWLGRYFARLAEDDAELAKEADREKKASFDRAETMRRANPRYIMRNWMLIRAYEAAERGDYSVLHELHALLQRPYDNQGPEADAKWYQRTPEYARAMPGALFLS